MINELVEIGGQQRPVNFGRNAQAEIEAITGISILDPHKLTKVGVASYTFIRAVAFAGLKWGLYNPANGQEPKVNFTLFQVGDWIENGDLGDDGPMAKIVSLFQKSLPLRSKNAGAEASTPQNGQILTPVP